LSGTEAILASRRKIYAPASSQFTKPRLYGTAETALVIVVMAGGYRVSGRLARRRRTAAPSSGTPEPALADA
jgi:hypothetical protein